MLSNLSVITGLKLTDTSVPADRPVQEWIDRLVDVLAKRYQGQDIGFDFQQEAVWSVAKIGEPPVRREQTLNDAEIVDGDHVVVRPVSRTERYRARHEDIIDVVAIMHPGPRFDASSLMSWLSWWTALMLVLVAVSGIYGFSTSGVWAWPWWGGGLVAVGVACAGLSVQVARRGQEQVASALAAGSVANLVVAAGLLVPLPERYDWLGAPQVAGASVAMLICSIVLSSKGPRQWRAWTAFLAAGSVLCAAAAFVIAYGGKGWVWPALTAAGLLLLKSSSRMVVRVARIALPPIPTPGMEVDMDELLDPVVDVKAEAGDADRQTWAKIIASVPESSARLAERSELCQQLLAGFMGAAAAAIAVGTVLSLRQGHFLPLTVVLTVLAIVVLLFRFRLPEDRRCKWSLLSAAAAIGAGAAIKMALWWPAWAPLVALVVLVSVGLILAAVAAGPFGLNEIQHRMLEIVDTMATGVMFPLLAWSAGLFDILRNLQIPGAN
ncbi:type VII secretion integral membrane protein EccD [Mycolicibacterium goodii]|uniref:type VII secretion integral membrane protein EccD n=1 Tax=Mycolicibacterium goodii TaxID=134601 RepID=UPI001BDD7486|nr:type VII secretion integral membrane protein EccD [Mycolicibacterium goodii]MBU8814047.1 type VII secretion integral membrane protein EccD [Mycolicibacterium goodii]